MPDFATPVEWDAPIPARDLLPPLDRYARLEVGSEQRLVGAVLASHGCAHRCRHCPVPVVFDGRVRRLDEDAVLADIAQLVEAGARHITFGDPDFLNAPPHSRRVVRAMHERFPDVTFDCTVKVEHVLRYRGLRHDDLWPELADAGCLFVVSAFESVDDAVLARLDKGHSSGGCRGAPSACCATRASTSGRRGCRSRRGPPATSFVALLDFVHDHDLVGSVDPVQYSVRLLLPKGSLLLDSSGPRPARRSLGRGTVDVLVAVGGPGGRRRCSSGSRRWSRRTATPRDLYAAVRAAAGAPPVDLTNATVGRPRLTESWFCCAEPTELQLQRSGATEVSLQSRC